jgi:hypothetical protein
MATHKISYPILSTPIQINAHRDLWRKYVSFVHSQEAYAAAWWICTLILEGVLVPITFLIVWDLDGPVIPFLFISMSCFFINVIANMSGAAFKFVFNSFISFILIHLLLVIMSVIL